MTSPTEGIVAATGHRDIAAPLRVLRAFAIVEMHRAQPRKAISGLALGWDTAWALAALDLGVPLLTASPFPEQASRWRPESVALREKIISRAESHHECNPCYAPAAFRWRNIWMVNNSSATVAMWDGRKTGGTVNYLDYARSQRHIITQSWQRWLAFIGQSE